MIIMESDFEILAPVVVSVVCFRFRPDGYNEGQINSLNEKLMHTLNDSGKIYLTHTVLDGRFTLRMVTAQTNVTFEHVEKAWELIKKTARDLLN
jgi:aromatic-L-amino-acid decarboxylase